MKRHSRKYVRAARTRYIVRWRNIVLNVWNERPGGHTHYTFFGQTHEDFDRYIKEIATQRAGTRVPCSCFMCGNPRRHFGAPYKGEHDRWES